MDFTSISSDRKLVIIDNLIEQSLLDVYRYALALGLNPDTLTADWEPAADHEMNQDEVNQLLASLSRLASLQVKRAAVS